MALQDSPQLGAKAYSQDSKRTASACGFTGQAAREGGDSLGSAKAQRLVKQTISSSRRRGGRDEAGLPSLYHVDDLSRFRRVFEPSASRDLESGLIQSVESRSSKFSARSEKQFHALLDLQPPSP